jgi:two-component system cell cycle sensor histidine kinase/response regulator CckA
MHDHVSDLVTTEPSAATIVVVEDESIIAADIQRILVGYGYRVPPPVSTAEEAIEAVESHHPDLVLMDVNLRGDRDGIDAAARIRERFGVPVVYLTSFSDEPTLARAKKTLPFGYVIKPFSERELRTAIEVALHKHASETKLVDCERWFSTTLQAIGDAVIATDRAETITFMNRAAEVLTTWSAGDALGKKLSEVFKVVDQGERRLESSVVRRLGDGFSVALPRGATAGARPKSSIVVEDSVSPVIDHKGVLLGGVVVFRDITDRRRMEQRLAASERLASLGSVTANMAHEINNPLTYVTINLTLARDLAARVQAGRGTEESRANDIKDLLATLEDAQEGAQRVLVLAREIRKVARAEGPTDKRVLDVPEVLDVAVKLTAHVVTPATRIEKRYTVTPYVEASETQLTQVFVNLLSNAAHAVAEMPIDCHRIVVSTRTDDAGRAVIEVRDTGRGIEKRHLSRLFEPFFTTKDAGVGTGLGLSISHATVTSLGGEIEVESEPGRGAVFRVMLPPAAARSEDASSSSMRAVGRRGRILVIDDEPAVGTALQRVLSNEYDVVAEFDPRSALARIAASDSFDVIFCDLQMPGMSGVDVYQALAAANPELAKRIVFVSADAHWSKARNLLSSIANPLLAKPFTADSVRKIVKDYVR